MKKIIYLFIMAFAVFAGVFAITGCLGAEDSHEHIYEYRKTVYATCQRKGYDVYYCTVCGREENRNVTAAVPHEFLKIETVKPTCEEQGYTKKTCIYCAYSEKFDYTDALGHVPIAVSGRAPTCTTGGLTAGETCTRCNERLSEQIEIDPLGHNLKITARGKEATCTDTGLTDRIECTVCGEVVQEQEVTPYMHSDGDSDDFCDKCSRLIGDNIVDIGSAEQLKNISYNTNGKYRLVSDIVLTGTWVPLGTSATPFTGKLDGGNHSIKNLSVSGSLAGLFGYSSGNIENLKIENYSYNGTYSYSQWDYASSVNLNYGKQTVFAGAICGVNNGVIKNCSLNGNLSVRCSTNFVLGVKNPYPTGSAYYEFSVGGLVGKNNKGIENCSVNGTATFNYGNTAEYYVDRNFFTGMQLGAGYKKFINSMTVNFGWVTGYNADKVTDCSVNAACSYAVAIKAHQDGFGHAIAENVINIGSAIGFSNGAVDKLTAPAISLSPSVTLTATPPWSGQVGEYCNSFNNMTLNVGKNSNGAIGNK